MKNKLVIFFLISLVSLAIMLTALSLVTNNKAENDLFGKDSSANISTKKEIANKTSDYTVSYGDIDVDAIDTSLKQYVSTQKTKHIIIEHLMHYAESLIGKPYKYACSDTEIGFDCSGFVSHVFGHFGMELPRSSRNYISIGKNVPAEKAKRGDIILFTGTTNFDKNIVGHVGIVYENAHVLRFIHSSSGKAMGVVITPLSGGYTKRFIKVIRVLPQNDK